MALRSPAHPLKILTNMDILMLSYQLLATLDIEWVIDHRTFMERTIETVLLKVNLSRKCHNEILIVNKLFLN